MIEAKDNSHALGDGLQQALAYAEALRTPFVFASNGDGFVFHDRTGQGEAMETTLALEAFPTTDGPNGRKVQRAKLREMAAS